MAIRDYLYVDMGQAFGGTSDMNDGRAGDVGAIEPRGMFIRRAREEDLDPVIALDIRVTGVAKPDYWEDLFERFVSRQRNDRLFLIAEPAGRIAMQSVLGFIVGEVRVWEFGSDPCGWVFAVSVAPDTRLERVGSQLLTAIADRFRSAGVHQMRTMVSRDNHLLMAFFRSHGMMAGPYIELEMDLQNDAGFVVPEEGGS